MGCPPTIDSEESTKHRYWASNPFTHLVTRLVLLVEAARSKLEQMSASHYSENYHHEPTLNAQLSLRLLLSEMKATSPRSNAVSRLTEIVEG